MKYLVTYSTGVLGAGLERQEIVEASSPKEALIEVQKRFVVDGLVVGVVILSVEKRESPPNGEKEEK